MSVTSLQLSQQGVLLWVIALVKKVFLCYDVVTNRLRMSINVIFFEHEYYFQQHVPCSNGVLLPTFDDISPPILRYQPSFVYSQR
jgi:hypothetical protein